MPRQADLGSFGGWGGAAASAARNSAVERLRLSPVLTICFTGIGIAAAAAVVVAGAVAAAAGLFGQDDAPDPADPEAVAAAAAVTEAAAAATDSVDDNAADDERDEQQEISQPRPLALVPGNHVLSEWAHDRWTRLSPRLVRPSPGLSLSLASCVWLCRSLFRFIVSHLCCARTSGQRQHREKVEAWRQVHAAAAAARCQRRRQERPFLRHGGPRPRHVALVCHVCA